jgi:hexokinase
LTINGFALIGKRRNFLVSEHQSPSSTRSRSLIFCHSNNRPTHLLFWLRVIGCSAVQQQQELLLFLPLTQVPRTQVRRCCLPHMQKESSTQDLPPRWSIDSSWIPFTSSFRDRKKLSPSPRIPLLYLCSGLVLLLVLGAQLLLSRSQPVLTAPAIAHQPTETTKYPSPFGDSVYRQEAYFDQLEPGTQCKPKNIISAALPTTLAPKDMALAAEVKRVAALFDYPKDEVNKGVQEYIRQMNEGLEKQGTMLSQIPTYVTNVPNGTEKGTYLAVDLGGTNFRVCSIVLHGNHTFSLQQSKVAVPRTLMEAKKATDLFHFLAQQIETFLKEHHGDHFEKHKQQGLGAQEFFDLGFTFSFPVNQIGINKGRLMRWTKGFDIDEALGQDVCALLQKEIDVLELPVRVAALVNDTVGTLMARSYTSPGKTKTLIGAIFGTGTNGAYVEKLDKVTKMKEIEAAEGEGGYDSSTGLMVINSEWGSFDNALRVLPNTQYDVDLDKESVNPGIQMFEKRVSGMFLGEILRRALLALYKNSDETIALFKDKSSADNDTSSTTTVANDSPLYKQWGIDTSFLSIVEEDSSDHLRITKQTLEKDLGVSAPSTEDCAAVKALVHAIGKRAARLSAVALAGVIIGTDKLKEDEIVDIGVDGSLVEYYPGFEDYIREAFQEIDGIGDDEKRIRIGLAKDGSGLGAALIALVAARA